jgi:hypothetical protein
MEPRVGPDGPERRNAMTFPVSYFDYDGTPKEGAAGTADVFALVCSGEAAIDAKAMRAAISILHQEGFAVTRVCPPFAGQIARVQIDVYGESASEVESTLLEYAERCDAASQASEVAYGRCVIERNLEEEWGATYSWRGRLVLHPTIGTIPSSARAAAHVAD